MEMEGCPSLACQHVNRLEIDSSGNKGVNLTSFNNRLFLLVYPDPKRSSGNDFRRGVLFLALLKSLIDYLILFDFTVFVYSRVTFIILLYSIL